MALWASSGDLYVKTHPKTRIPRPLGKYSGIPNFGIQAFESKAHPADLDFGIAKTSIERSNRNEEADLPCPFASILKMLSNFLNLDSNQYGIRVRQRTLIELSSNLLEPQGIPRYSVKQANLKSLSVFLTP